MHGHLIFAFFFSWKSNCIQLSHDHAPHSCTVMKIAETASATMQLIITRDFPYACAFALKQSYSFIICTTCSFSVS
ncbi:hypothetical protein BX666DRAFT_2007569 [Dichotomocladium elegans]|nr:hypothetical protein BX666DRAFT_2007569 [Dichotomocladium elegans]